MPSQFPTTAVLDDGQRADEDPVAAPWTTLSGLTGLVLASNQFKVNTAFGASYRGSYLNPECWYTIDTYAGQHYQWLRLHDALGGNPITDAHRQGYQVAFNSTNYFVYKVDDGVNTLILGPTNWTTPGITWSNGIKVGSRIVSTTLEVWIREAGGPDWEFVDSVAASTYTNAGAIAVQLESTTARLSVIGGGEYRESQSTFYSRTRRVHR